MPAKLAKIFLDSTEPLLPCSFVHKKNMDYVTCSQRDSRRLGKGRLVGVRVVAIGLISRAREPQSGAFRVFSVVGVMVNM